jgi:ABC-type amino acid transport substrate-binding protein
LAAWPVLGAAVLSGANAAEALKVGAALPDPPFDFLAADGPAGFDVALMRHVAALLGRPWQLIPYGGADFNGIFAGLGAGAYDCIASGTTITAARERVADFCAPYVVSGQALVVDLARHPQVRSTDELRGLVIGVQQGNTSQPVADRLVAEGRAARVRVCPYDTIEQALDDLSSGGCDVFMKLGPVLEWFVRGSPRLKVVQTGITQERLAICVRKGNTALREAIDTAQAALRKDGTLQALMDEWLGTTATAA